MTSPNPDRTRGRLGLALKIGLVLLLTAGCMVYVLWGIEISAATEAVAAFDWKMLVPAMVLYTLIIPPKAWRFQLLCDHPVTFRDMVSVVTVGFLAVNVVPLRMGELVRPYLLAERYETPFGTGMAAVVLERLLDMAALLTLMLLAGILVDLPPGGIQVGGIDLLMVGQRTMTVSLGVGVLGIAMLVAVGDRAVEALAQVADRVGVPAAAELVRRLGLRFVAGFRALGRQPTKALLAAGCTFFIWFFTYVAILCFMAGFPGLTPDPSLGLLNIVGAITGLVLIPTPGFFGAYEAGSTASLVLGGIDKTVASAFSILVHVSSFAHTVVIGTLFLFWEGWSLVELVRESRESA